MTFRTIILTVLFIAAGVAVCAGADKNLDSLYKVAFSGKNDESVANAVEQLDRYYWRGDPDSSVKYLPAVGKLLTRFREADAAPLLLLMRQKMLSIEPL